MSMWLCVFIYVIYMGWFDCAMVVECRLNITESYGFLWDRKLLKFLRWTLMPRLHHWTWTWGSFWDPLSSDEVWKNTYDYGAVCLQKMVMGLEKALFLEEEHVLRINRCIMEWYFQECTYIDSITSAVKLQLNVQSFIRTSLLDFKFPHSSPWPQTVNQALWLRFCFHMMAIWWCHVLNMCISKETTFSNFQSKKLVLKKNYKSHHQPFQQKTSKNPLKSWNKNPLPGCNLHRFLPRKVESYADTESVFRKKCLQGATSLPKVVLLANDPKQVARLTVRSHPGQEIGLPYQNTAG